MTQKRNLFTSPHGGGWLPLLALLILPIFVAALLSEPISLLLQILGLNIPLHRVVDRLLLITALGVLIFYHREIRFSALWPFTQWTVAAVGFGFFLAVMTVQIIFAFCLLSGCFELDLHTLPASRWALLALAMIVVPFLEETLFRGFILAQLRRNLGATWALVFSSLLYAAVHFLHSDFLLVHFVNLFLLGLILGGLFLRSGQLWLSFGFHSGAIVGLFLLPDFLHPSSPAFFSGFAFLFKGEISSNFLTTLALFMLTLWLWKFYSPKQS